MEIKNSTVHGSRLLFVLAAIASFSNPAAAEQTPSNEDGAGNVIYLDRHAPDCGFNGIESLQLVRPSASQIAYKYQCQWTGNTNRLDQYTPANEDGGGNAVYLDRHAVDCAGKALQYVHLYRPSGNQIAYHYRCGERALANVRDYHTPGSDDGGGNAVFLDRHELRCPAGEMLTYMRLYRPTPSTIAYHYRCGETNPKQTEPNEDGGGNLIYLDRHALNCKSSGIGALRLFRPTINQIAFSYQCEFGGGDDAVGAEQNTPANEDGGGNVIYLDRHGVDCGGKALQYVHLYRPSATQIAYQYRCGSQALTNVMEYRTPANEDGAGNAVFLDRHDVRCPAGDVLSYMRLYRPTASTIAYHYKCGKYLQGKPQAYALVQSAYERSVATLYGTERQEMDLLKASLNTQIDNASGLSLDEFYQLGKRLSDQIEQLYASRIGSGARMTCPLN